MGQLTDVYALRRTFEEVTHAKIPMSAHLFRKIDRGRCHPRFQL